MKQYAGRFDLKIFFEREKKGVVYEVPYAECGCVYIRETGRMLEKRLSEHRSRSRQEE